LLTASPYISAPDEVLTKSGKITHNTSIEQIAEYYPFGLQQGSNSFACTGSTNNPLTYNGKELKDELNLGWLDYGARTASNVAA
jgi:hypothetical protein